MKWFMKLSPIAQGAIVIAIILVIWYMYKNSKAFFQSLSTTVSQNGEAAGYEAAGQTKSYTDSQFKTFADKLFDAMDGPGTDENAIYAVFGAMNNDLDVLSLEQAFSLRDSAYNYFDSAVDLGSWLRSDLSSDELQKVNGILAGKNIKKQY